MALNADCDALPRIIRLEESVVNRIAAGEVVQRPSSAVKELIENSLDAGATSINVVTKQGGLKLISITDNGCGILADDLPILCERHTTSKLTCFEDLQSISSMGFRGEALASMSYVSHLTVTTMTHAQQHGFRATYKDGKMEGDAKPCAAVRGTQITIEDLFYNVTARRKAFKSVNEEYSRILDVVTKFAVHHHKTSFICKKHGESRPDIHTAQSDGPLDAIRSVYGPSTARELVAVSIKQGEDMECPSLQLQALVSNANYSAKKTTMLLYINNRAVESTSLKRVCENVYSTLLPKAAKPFLYLSLSLPPHQLDINVHPTKKQVSFLNEESVVECIQRVLQQSLRVSNNSRVFHTQTLLQAVGPSQAAMATQGTQSQASQGEKQAASHSQPASTQPRKVKVPSQKLVRVDHSNPQGQLMGWVQTQGRVQGDQGGGQAAAMAGRGENQPAGEEQGKDEKKRDSAAMAMQLTRRIVRQRRSVDHSRQLTSVQELLDAMDRSVHSGLTELLQSCSYVGMADDVFCLVQHKTSLFLLDVIRLSHELAYQQILRRFSLLPTLRLSNPPSLSHLLTMALEDEEESGRWDPSDGSKEDIVKAALSAMQGKHEMLRDYFSIGVTEDGTLETLPALQHYTPDMDRLPSFVLALTSSVDWDHEKECFESVAMAVASFYALHPPILPRTFVGCGSLGAAQSAWSRREWTVQHTLLPALKLYLKPPSRMATNGSVIEVACLENLYKVFERC